MKLFVVSLRCTKSFSQMKFNYILNLVFCLFVVGEVGLPCGRKPKVPSSNPNYNIQIHIIDICKSLSPYPNPDSNLNLQTLNSKSHRLALAEKYMI